MIQFQSNFFDSTDQIAYLGEGGIGGKAAGLSFINQVLEDKISKEDSAKFEVNIPKMVVLRSDIFDSFMELNNLWGIALSNKPNHRIALAFQKAEIPFNILGDLRTIVSEVKRPLAIRSSSLLEDAMHEPFAGIYGTKMTPNNQLDVDTRFRKLVEGIKYVYASTFFKESKNYFNAINHKIEDEKMAVIIQEVVGERHDDRFYPELSGVARSYNFYPTAGAKPEEGVVNLAMGLGKTIVDGGVSWAYSPSFPHISPPFKTTRDLLYYSQLKFWSINMGKPPSYDPVNETEYMFEKDLEVGEKDDTIRNLVSTYDSQSDRVWLGQSGSGPRILTFAPLLQLSDIPINDLLKKLMTVCEEALNAPVEIEFAVTFSDNVLEKPHRFGFLQVRPMVVSSEEVQIEESELNDSQLIASSNKVLGNGIVDQIHDVIYLKQENFNSQKTYEIAAQIEKMNNKLVEQANPYLLIGFGRWGTTDPWAGIPVDWSQISGAKVIVESTMPNMIQDMSQASHFFHNVTSFQVLYFSVPYSGQYKINYDLLADMEIVEETEFVKHVRSVKPLLIKSDGRSGSGVILK